MLICGDPTHANRKVVLPSYKRSDITRLPSMSTLNFELPVRNLVAVYPKPSLKADGSQPKCKNRFVFLVNTGRQQLPFAGTPESCGFHQLRHPLSIHLSSRPFCVPTLPLLRQSSCGKFPVGLSRGIWEPFCALQLPR